MPIITVQFIKDVVATPEQKRELIIKLTDTFVGILGDVVRPFVYCIIQETPQAEWGIAGVPMPDLVYLTSEKHADVIERSNELMRGAIAQMAAAQQNSAEHADAIWRGEAVPARATVQAAQRIQIGATGSAGSTNCGTRRTTTSCTSTSTMVSRRMGQAGRTSRWGRKGRRAWSRPGTRRCPTGT